MKKGHILAIDTSQIFQELGGSKESHLSLSKSEKQYSDILQVIYQQAIEILENSIEPFELFMAETHETDNGEFMYTSGGFLSTYIASNDKSNYVIVETVHADLQKKLTTLVNNANDVLVQKRRQIYEAALQYVRDSKLKSPGIRAGVELCI